MKTKFKGIILLLLICNTVLFAQPFVGERIDEKLDVSYSYYQDDWIMGLRDGSSWKLLPLKEKRKQTWTEWWNKVEPKEWQLSEEFFFDPHSWKGKYTIKVMTAKDSLLSTYDFILVNEVTDQKVFAKFIPYGANFIPKMEYALKLTEHAQPTSSSTLASYTFMDDILVLENMSIWKLFLRKDENRRSFADWWNGVEIDQPDKEFISSLKDWKRGDQIHVYHAKFNDRELNDKYRVSKAAQEMFLIENATRSKLAYASAVPFKDLLEHFQKNSDLQYGKGHSQGFSDGYNKGYKEGHSAGLIEGYKNWKNEITPQRNEPPFQTK